jgi:hypothetical protein
LFVILIFQNLARKQACTMARQSQLVNVFTKIVQGVPESIQSTCFIYVLGTLVSTFTRDHVMPQYTVAIGKYASVLTKP